MKCTWLPPLPRAPLSLTTVASLRVHFTFHLTHSTRDAALWTQYSVLGGTRVAMSFAVFRRLRL